MKQYSTEMTVGMDIGDKKHWITILDEAGEVIEQTVFNNDKGSIQQFFDRFTVPSRVTVGMESGTHSPWLSRLLEDKGFRVLVGNARKLRAIWQSDNKDDPRDSEMLARIARFDPSLLYPIHHRGENTQAALAIMRARDALVSSRSSLICTCRGLVKSWGARLPNCSADKFAKAVTEYVPSELRAALLPVVRQISDLTQRIKDYDEKLKEISRRDYPETRLLTQVTGVGPITSLAFILTVESPDRFPKNRSIGPFLGLTPRRDQSGETDKELPISKAGDEFVRRLLAQAAQYILGPFGPDCELRRHGERILQQGKKGSRKKLLPQYPENSLFYCCTSGKPANHTIPFIHTTVNET